jgi:predicted RNA binding protein YcfA (HicA-like mRNA interferase family)
MDVSSTEEDTMMRELRAVERVARKQGWKVEPTRSGHYTWRNPDGVLVTVTPGSATGSRTAKNYLAYLRRGGLVLNGKAPR